MRCAAVSLLFVALAGGAGSAEPAVPGLAGGGVSISAKTSDGSAVVGRVTAYDLAGFTLSPSPAGDGRGEGPPPGGQAVQFRWSQFDAGAASRIFEKILADEGTGRQWLDAGRVLMGLPNGKNWAESAFLMALEKDASLKEDVAYAREGTTTVKADATTQRPDDATKTADATTRGRGDAAKSDGVAEAGDEEAMAMGESSHFISAGEGLSASQPDVTEASLPDCSNIVNLKKVAGVTNFFTFECNTKINVDQAPVWMIRVAKAKKMPPLDKARTVAQFLIRFEQRRDGKPLPDGQGVPITFDLKGWNAAATQRILYTYDDPDTPAAYEMKEGKSRWHELKAVGVIDRQSKEDPFDIRTRFMFTPAKPKVWVSRSYPYTWKLHQAYMQHLIERSQTDSFIKVFEAAQSDEGRVVHIVQIADGPDEELKTRPTFLIYAGEHPLEHAASHVTAGAIEFLAGESAEAAEIRKKAAFLVLPMMDPDGAVNGWMNNLTEDFLPQTRNKTVETLADYLGNRYDDGHSLHLSLDLHTSYSATMTPIQPALRRPMDKALFEEFQDLLQAGIGGLKLGRKPWVLGFPSTRLCGWHAECFGGAYLAYEINDLNALAALRDLSRGLVGACAAIQQSEALAKFDVEIQRYRERRVIDVAAVNEEYPTIKEASRLDREGMLEFKRAKAAARDRKNKENEK